ncbi:hypothetical protein NECAME_07399 [Necator americanus]|uniref:Uncharacterized protein n=1 Tax=Necator americanus TaxID=51031 RepID=W2TMQ8_NECAM|nr:hypothetical protein NECAME_07399 [Necator americanus]ETN83390.1 hypothetical protein NECAME_07399 [Necator americanus]
MVRLARSKSTVSVKSAVLSVKLPQHLQNSMTEKSYVSSFYLISGHGLQQPPDPFSFEMTTSIQLQALSRHVHNVFHQTTLDDSKQSKLGFR